MRLVVHDGKCTGCRLCEQICAIHHFKETNPKKAAIRIQGRFPAPGHYHLRVCSQCGECIDSCPVQAISKEDGVVRIDQAACSGCAVCVDACPEEAIFLHESLDWPIICDLCFECAGVCNTGALTREG